MQYQRTFLTSFRLAQKTRLVYRLQAPATTEFQYTILISASPRRPFSSTIVMASAVSDAIKHDHRELEEYYDKIINTSNHDEKERYQNAFTWELARHSLGEEIVVYPAMEKYLPGGKDMTDKDRAEHQTVKEQLHKFQQLPTSSPEFEPTLRRLMDNLKKHIEEEESEDLPILDSALSDDESAGLAASFRRTKKFVPTRSHPSAPDRPPFETVVGLMTAPIDKVMDAFRKFPKD